MVLALGAGVLTGCGGGDGAADASAPGTDAVRAAASVATQAPGAEPAPAPTVRAGIAAGTVRVARGPFTDRLRFHRLALRAGRVSGTVDVVSDVSEVIDLEVRVDFYDRAGALLGSARQVFDTENTEEFHTTAGVLGVPLSLPTPVEGARSAVLTVPVLVNE